uniref:Homeobox domain-containing protein n=1 Tax=Denticeps clupeoides TaxID=299321 RepID=A0AAY4CWN6_9TELE
MASKRKSAIPCMIPPKSKYREDIILGCLPELLPTIPEDSILSISGEEEEVHCFSKKDSKTTSNEESTSTRSAYSCLPCGFECRDLKPFLDHLDSSHPDFQAHPTFYCRSCGVSVSTFETLVLHNAKAHPGRGLVGSPLSTSLQITKKRGVSVVEQRIADAKEPRTLAQAGISIIKTPIMKIAKSKDEQKKIMVSHTVEVKKVDRGEISDLSIHDTQTPVINGAAGTLTFPSTVQMAPGLKTQNRGPLRHPANSSLPLNAIPPADLNNLPKVMIPLSSIPAYDSAMDSNSFLKTSFSKFPYPTKAELCYLTVVSDYAEEQIKLWFTAQRLKQGISWSPEEIEDARRKMFSTVFQTVPSGSQKQHPHQYLSQHRILTKTVATPNGKGVPRVSLTVFNIDNNISSKSPSLSSNSSNGSVSAFNSAYSNISNTSKMSQEQMATLTKSYVHCQVPDQREVERLKAATGLTVNQVFKWFSDQQSHDQNLKGICLQSTPPNVPHRALKVSSPNFTDVQNKNQDLTALEKSFCQGLQPSETDADHLQTETKSAATDIQSWFSENYKQDGDQLYEQSKERRCSSSPPKTEGRIRMEEGQSMMDLYTKEEQSESLRSEPKVNPIKINLKMLKVSEPDDKHGLKETSPELEGDSFKMVTWPSPSLSVLSDRISSDQLHLLRQAFASTPWPNNMQIEELIMRTGLPKSEVVRWFSDSRRIQKSGQLIWLDSYQSTPAEAKKDDTKYVNADTGQRTDDQSKPKGEKPGKGLTEDELGCELLGSQTSLVPKSIGSGGMENNEKAYEMTAVASTQDPWVIQEEKHQQPMKIQGFREHQPRDTQST